MADSIRSETATESNTLMRRAGWCGVVCALAIVLTSLNFLPPIKIQYHVRSKVVLSETRLAQLRELAIADRRAVKRSERKSVQLLAVKVLDLAKQVESFRNEPTEAKVVLAEIDTLWSSRCTSERHFAWLDKISKIDPSKLKGAQAAQAARFARWELEAAEHYQTQFNFLANNNPLEGSTPTVAENESPNRHRTFQLAAFSQPADGTQALPTRVRDSDGSIFQQQLSDQIAAAKTKVQLAERAWQKQLENSSGSLQIASLPVIAPRSTSMPLSMAVSILVLGMSAGSAAGWFQQRGLAACIYDPQNVAERLVMDSVPLAARLRLPAIEDNERNRPLDSVRLAFLGFRLTRLSEMTVGFWVAIAVGRFFLDSAWRDVLVDSPLAALGRLLAGMP